MQKGILVFSFMAIIAFSISGVAQADAKTKLFLEERVEALEAILTPTVLDQTQQTQTNYDIFDGKISFVTLQNPEDPNCNYINIGTLLEPNLYVLGWCPSSHEYIYFIQDLRVIVDSLIITNVQRGQDRLGTEIQIPPDCSSISSGFFTFPTRTFTGFILSCQGASPESIDSLRYTVL